MKTYIERFAERYYVVTSSNLHLSNDKSKAYISDDLILLDTFFDVLAVAKAIFYTGTFKPSAVYVNKFVELAKPYHCKVITVKPDESRIFQIFRSKRSAEQFKALVDSKLLLNEMRDE